MDYLLDRLRDNFDVNVIKVYENKLNQTVLRMEICDKGFSVVQPIEDEEVYEILYTLPNKNAIQLPFTEPDVEVIHRCGLSVEEVVTEVQQASADILQKVLTNPVLAKHGINI